MRVPVGIDPTETWEIDYCAAAAEHAIGIWRANVEAARAELAALPTPPACTTDEAKAKNAAERKAFEARLAAAEKGLAEAEAELAAYVKGTGPVFTLGWMPPQKRAMVAGMMSEAHRAVTDDERLEMRADWRREVVRWTVRGHANLVNAKGEALKFDGKAVTLDGETYTQPSARQLNAYAFLGSLADLCLAAQSLPELEKNA
jgi:hypothetical protein